MANEHCIIHRGPDAATVARELADFVALRLREGLDARGTALLFVSGGGTPVPFFAQLAQAPLDWTRVQVSLADDRWLPPDHPDSNNRLVRQHLLQGPAAQARLIPLVNDAATPDEGQPATESALSALPWPAEVMVLGMGDDGHTASLFPHDAALATALDERADGPRCVAVQAPERPNVPVARISLTRRALLDARHLVVHTTGASKWALLERAGEPGPATVLPIRVALHQHSVPCHLFHAD